MASLHQFRCFLATYELGSLTAAGEELGYSQPSISEQVRLLERSVGATLFRRVGRGVVPTEAAEAIRPHAERSLAAADAAGRAVAAVSGVTAGTIRFGMFGTARLFMGAQLVADVLERHPGVRVELVGQNSADVQEELRRGRLEAAIIAIPVATEGMTVRPVARDELVYLSSDPSHLAKPMTAAALGRAPLVLSETSWRQEDSTRRILRELLQHTGQTLRTRIEVEDVETAVEAVGLGLADSVLPKSVVDQLVSRLAPHVGWVPLRPRLYETLAVVHRNDAELSAAATMIIELATRRIQSMTEAV